ncbi:DUF1998 domain-containing protein [Streptomyces pratens]
MRLNPFYVCTSCGGATADGRPVVDQSQHALTASLAHSTRASAHHQLWCPRRRLRDSGEAQGAGADVPLLLAHELTTEAVRILLPASVARAKERLASFTAALFAGIAARYGGDPDHIDITAASMPDGEDRDWPRRFLVVYDRLPGGTGYLHRLATSDGFREVLLKAREVIEDCDCLRKGLDGCHRCLLRRVPPADYDKVSRNEVRQMLDELLGADGERWSTSPVTTTQHIPMHQQAESDLEVLFIDTLREWSALPENRASGDAYVTPASTHALDLRLTAADGTTLSWRVSQQRVLDGTRPDVLFERVDAPGVHAREEAHKRRWRAWLYWSNLLQFLDSGGGDAVQLTSSRLDGFPVEILAVTGGSGVLESVRVTLAADAATGGAPGGGAPDGGTPPPAEVVPPAPSVPSTAEVSTGGGTPPVRDAAWDRVVKYLDPDEPGLRALAEALAARGVPAPEDGYELDADGWLAELAWPTARVGVVLAQRPPEGEEEDPEAADRDRAFAAAGWEVRTAAGWTAGDLADRLDGAPPSGDPKSRHQSDGTTTDNGGNGQP